VDDLAALALLAFLVGFLLLLFFSALIGLVFLVVIVGIFLGAPVLRGLLGVLRSRPRGR
jgi:hypothetical protein